MGTFTPIHGFMTWAAGITQPNAPYNDLIAMIDQKLGIRALSRTTDAQPGSPTEGDAYIMTASASGGSWAGYSEHDIAFYIGAAWTAFAPTGALPVFVVDDDEFIAWNGTDWTLLLYDNTTYFGQDYRTGVAEELVLGNAGAIVEMDNAASNVLTIPANSAVEFPVKTRIDVVQYGAGETSLDITDDTLLGGRIVIARYNAISLYKRAATEWIAFGGTT